MIKAIFKRYDHKINKKETQFYLFFQAPLHGGDPISLFVNPQLAHIFEGKQLLMYC